MQASIDFNCDLGEGIADDVALLPWISSANIACGFHAGDPQRMQTVVAGCVQHGVAIGAHPSYFDRDGFGRRERGLDAAAIYPLVLYQVSALDGFARAAGTRLHHVKPHGALYNRAADDRAAAEAIARAVADFDRRLIVYALSGSVLAEVAEAAGLGVAHEVFAERRYDANGRLAARGEPGAVIERLEDAIAQVRGLLRDGRVVARDGTPVAVRPDTLCLHGDRTDALDFARALRHALQQEGVAVRAPIAVGSHHESVR